MSNINPNKIAENFAKQYSTDGEGDNYSRAQFSGLTLGVVVDTDDPLQMGRLRIFCPSLNDSPKKPQLLPWATYITPFGGSINNSEFYRGTDENNATSSGSLHYGFWAVPEMGAQVLVGCVDGDPRRRFWIGCVPEHQQTHTLHNGRWKWKDGVVDGPLTGNGSPMQPAHANATKAFDGRNDSPEWRSRIADYQTTANSEDVGQLPNSKMTESLDQQNSQIRANDPDTWERATLGSHGYDWSGFKKLDYKSSRVVGLSTPGMHSLVMDDRPFNNRIRLKTTAGHQILLDDTNERIYISTYDGENWMEFDRNGNIDMFSANRISIHAAKDLNFNAGQTIRFFAGEGIHGYCGSDIVTQDVFDYENPTGILRQDPLEQPPQPGEIRFHATADLHLKSEQNIRQLSLVDTFMEANGNFWGKVDKSYYLQVATDININTDTGDWNLTTANNINETTLGNAKRFSYGTTAIAANDRTELFSFESTVDIGAQTNLNLKSSNADVTIESLGNGSNSGNISIRSPNSQLQIGNDGITGMTDSTVALMGHDSAELSVDQAATSKVSAPVSVSGLPDINTECSIPSGPLPWDGSRQTITDEEAVRVAYNAGWRGTDLITAVAIMKAESSLRTGVANTAAKNGTYGATVGLFQIRTLNEPDKYGAFEKSIRDNRNRQLENPNNNAAAAYKIFSQMSPKNKWSVGKWASLGDGGVTRNMAAASAVVSRLCPSNSSSNDAQTTISSFSLGYDIGEDELVPIEAASFSTFSKITALDSIANSTIPNFTKPAIQLGKELAKLQGMSDIEFKTTSALNNKSYNNIISTINTTVSAVDQVSMFVGDIVPKIAQGLATAGTFTLNIPFAFDLPCLALNIYSALMPPELLAIAATLEDLNNLLEDIMQIPLTLYNLKEQLEGNVEALLRLGLPITFKFNVDPSVGLCVSQLNQLNNDLSMMGIPTLTLPSFYDKTVNKILRNNSIKLNLIN